jgi:hypothetical protein
MVFAQLNPLQGPLCGIQLGKNLMGQAPVPSAGDTGQTKGYFIAGMAFLAHNFYFSAFRNLTSSIMSSVLNKVLLNFPCCALRRKKIEVRVKQKLCSFTPY